MLFAKYTRSIWKLFEVCSAFNFIIYPLLACCPHKSEYCFCFWWKSVGQMDITYLCGWPKLSVCQGNQISYHVPFLMCNLVPTPALKGFWKNCAKGEKHFQNILLLIVQDLSQRQKRPTFQPGPLLSNMTLVLFLEA